MAQIITLQRVWHPEKEETPGDFAPDAIQKLRKCLWQCELLQAQNHVHSGIMNNGWYQDEIWLCTPPHERFNGADLHSRLARGAEAAEAG